MRRAWVRAGVVAAVVTLGVGLWLQRSLRANAGPRAPHLPTPKLTLGAYASPPTVADAARWQAFLKRTDTTALNTVVIDLMTPAGVHLRGASGLAARIAAPPALSYDLATRTAEAHARHLFVIGRLVVARNPRLLREKPDWAIQTRQGHRWTDALGRAAVDVTSDDACDFLADIARAAARAGVDEVMLDELEVPPAAGGAPGRVLASSRHDRPAHAAVTACVRSVAATVRRAHAILGVAVPGRLCTDVGSAGLNGQRWEDLALAADRLSPEIYPHSVPSSAGGRMTAQPYQAVSTVVAMCYTRNLRLIKALAGRPVRVARIEPWIQAYSSRGVSYGPRALAEQLRGLREHGVGNALLWNGESDYDRFTTALHGPAPTRVVAYNPTAAQWAKANRAPMVVGK